MRRAPSFLLCACLAMSSPAALAQEPPSAAAVALPHGVGNLLPSPAWTVLRAADLALPSRPTDPTEDPARKVLVSTCATLVARKRADEHVLLHQPGLRPTQLRLINVHSVEERTTCRDLVSPEGIARFRGDFERGLAGPDNTIEYVEERVLDLFADLKCLSLTFKTTSAGDSWLLTYYFVPSGERLTYFETVHFPADLDARQEIEAVLRTFDGARDPGAATDLLVNMTIAGITGAIGGALAGLWWRRRRMQAAPSSASAG